MDEALIGNSVSQKWLDSAADELRKESPDDHPDEETLFLLDDKGEFSGLKAPRWLCHLVGLPHGTVHVLLWSANNEPRMISSCAAGRRRNFRDILNCL